MRAQSGSIFFYILLGIALFAAISYAISQAMRLGGGSMNVANEEKMRLVYSEIQQQVEAHRVAIRQMIANGVSVDAISAEVPVYYPHPNPNCTSDACKLYSPNGGGLEWYKHSILNSTLTDVPNEVDQWTYAPNGVYWTWYSYKGTSSPDLIYAARVTKDFCNFIDKTLGITADVDTFPPVTLGFLYVIGATPRDMIGTVDHIYSLTSPDQAAFLMGKSEGCFLRDPGHDYYYVALLYAT